MFSALPVVWCKGNPIPPVNLVCFYIFRKEKKINQFINALFIKPKIEEIPTSSKRN